MNLIIYNNTPLAKPISNIIEHYINYSSENIKKLLKESNKKILNKRALLVGNMDLLDLVMKCVMIGRVGFVMKNADKEDLKEWYDQWKDDFNVKNGILILTNHIGRICVYLNDHIGNLVLIEDIVPLCNII